VPHDPDADRRGVDPRERVVRDLVVRLVLCTLLAAVVAAPLAVAWAVSRTEVRQTVGITPTTFSLSTSGHSEVRLGVAGTIYLPRSRGPLGLVATVDGPAAPEGGSGDLASYVTPDMLRLYTGLFHDPEPAIKEYVDLLVRALWHRMLSAELVLAASGGISLLALQLLLSRRPPGSVHDPVLPRDRRRTAAAVVVVLVASTAAASAVLAPASASPGPEALDGVYDLPSLAGTPVAGSTTNSPVLRLLLSGTVPKVQQLIRRQEEGVRDYRAAGLRSLRRQGGAMEGPREDERAVLMQSDMHCNTTMITVQHTQYGDEVLSLMAITGDLTTNGTAAEGRCIEDEAAIAAGAPVAAVSGNHESSTSIAQMKAADMTVLEGRTADVGGVSVLGASDPERSELFGGTHLRGTDTEGDVGARLRRTAEKDRPDLLLVHEAYAAQTVIGVDDMTDFLGERGDPTAPYDDDVDDLPAGAVLYGHWHRSIAPRVVWNSDGTWTLVMELDTSGGAIDTPTIGHFSTPWSRPQQEASFPVLFLDRTSGLVTGYQLYRFAVDGRVTVEPRVDVGVPPTPDPRVRLVAPTGQ
jgi:predicted phosphodiesterase